MIAREKDTRATMRSSPKTKYNAPNKPTSPVKASETSSGRKRLPERKFGKFTRSARQLVF